METELEVRFTADDALEVRAGTGDTPSKLVGYAAVFGSLSADLGGFQERIMPGAFKGSINGTNDIRALVDHDSTKLLGRTSNNTLRVAEDARGLRMEVDLPNTSYANDVKTLVARGDIKGMSFGFRVPDGGQRFTKENGITIRELTNVNLKEVTVTSIPAYGATSVEARVDPSVARHIAQENPRPNFARCAAALRYQQVKG